jgi:cell division protein FtsQ
MDIRGPLKKILAVALWCILGGGALALLVAAINKKNGSVCKGVEVQINADGKEVFVSKREVLRILEKEGIKDMDEKRMKNFNLQKLEDALRKNAWIKDAQLYFDNNQVLRVRITEREPVARIFMVSGGSFYMDSSGKQLPLAGTVALRLPVFTGYPSDKMGSRADSELDRQVKDLGLFLKRDSFWNQAIEQVNITPSKTFEMTPLIGDQVIEFGDGNNYVDKFHRLMIFYKKVMAVTGFEKYTRIKVQYAGQIIGTRRGGPVSRTDSLQALRNVMDMIRMARKTEMDTATVRDVKPLEKNVITEQNLNSYDFPEDKNEGAEQKK